MELRPEDREIINNAFTELNSSFHNMNCLFLYLKDEYPERSSIQDLVLFMGLIRMKDIEDITHTSLKYPIFGKEIEQISEEELKVLLYNTYHLDRYGYLDYSDSPVGVCINEDLSLYERIFSDGE